MLNNDKPKVVVISGTNASGKSSLGIKLALKYGGEIISADSRQIYRGFDLCCGKVNSIERAMVPHHMIDICSIGDSFSVADYQKQVLSLIPEIIERGKIPFIVGGTGLYIDSVVKGYHFEDEISSYSLREELNEKSLSELQHMLSDDAKRFLADNVSDYNNKRRLIRIIEKEKNGIELVNSFSPQLNALQIGVTWPKEILFKRIDDRLKDRIQKGMINEIRDYLEADGNANYLYSLGLEYKYIAWYIENRFDSIDAFSDDMSKAIKRFAKQQIKWFKRNPAIHWIDMTQDYYSESCRLIDYFIYES